MSFSGINSSSLTRSNALVKLKKHKKRGFLNSSDFSIDYLNLNMVSIVDLLGRKSCYYSALGMIFVTVLCSIFVNLKMYFISLLTLFNSVILL